MKDTKEVAQLRADLLNAREENGRIAGLYEARLKKLTEKMGLYAALQDTHKRFIVKYKEAQYEISGLRSDMSEIEKLRDAFFPYRDQIIALAKIIETAQKRR